MQTADFPAFEQAFNRLCAAFDTPPTPARKDAYWQAFRKIPRAQFLAGIDAVLTDGDFESMPSVTKLRAAMRRPEAMTEPATPSGPSLQAQLCEYVMLAYPRLADEGNGNPDAALQRALPWTYLYREWSEGGKKCAECVGVAIPARGHMPGFRVMVIDMRADEVLHAKVLRKLAGQAQPDMEAA